MSQQAYGTFGAVWSGVFPSFDLQGAGTDEKVLVEILASRTPAEVNAIKAAYKKGKTVNSYIYFISTPSLNHPEQNEYEMNTWK